ncbi:MAG: SLC13 family permease, partial [Oscillospiraceae bacterium]|nr:SLC13 family permease [Oscillospiraceae bacterium]
MFAQIIAICIFVTMFLLIILDKFERHYITLGSGALVLVLVFGVCMHSMSAILETLNLGAFFQSTFWYGASEESTAGINWSTILFIAGMMIMVEGLGKAGFFRWLCLTLAKLVHYRTVPLLICFMSLSAFLSMFIDSIT